MMWLCWLTHGHGSCWMMYWWNPHYVGESPSWTLGTMSLTEAPSQDDIVQKALKQGVGWNCIGRLGSATNNYKWSFTSKMIKGVFVCVEEVCELCWLKVIWFDQVWRSVHCRGWSWLDVTWAIQKERLKESKLFLSPNEWRIETCW